MIGVVGVIGGDWGWFEMIVGGWVVYIHSKTLLNDLGQKYPLNVLYLSGCKSIFALYFNRIRIRIQHV